MCSFSDKASFIQNQNLVGMEDCADSLGYNDHGFILYTF